MSTTSLIRPTGPSSGGSATPHLVFLASGLLVFAILWALPVAVLVWLSSMFFGSVGIAEALEHTRGLAPTTYGGAFWLAVVVTVTMVVFEVRTLVRGAPERGSWLLRFITRPSTAYFVLIGPTLLLVRVDTRGTDVPDILTTTLLLCCLGYVWFVLPLGVAAVAWRLTWWMWRKGTSSGFASGVLGTLGLSFAVCTPVVCVVNDEDDPPKPVAHVSKAFGRGFARAKSQDAIDGSRTLMGSLAEVIDAPEPPPRPSRADSDERAGFPFLHDASEPESVDSVLLGECMNELQHGRPESHRDKKINFIAYQVGLGTSAAEEIVDRAILELCVGYAARKVPLSVLPQLFGLRADSRLKNWYRHKDVRNRCATLARAEAEYLEPMEMESAEVDDALCKLKEVDRRILEMSVQGHEAKEIGEQLGLSAANVRQRKHRALEQMRRLLQLH